MNLDSFIAKQLRDFSARALFEPFTITLVDGTMLHVDYRSHVTMLSEGAFVTEGEETEAVFRYEQISSIRTIFQPQPEKPDETDI